jgi:hypothetical protein
VRLYGNLEGGDCLEQNDWRPIEPTDFRTFSVGVKFGKWKMQLLVPNSEKKDKKLRYQ